VFAQIWRGPVGGRFGNDQSRDPFRVRRGRQKGGVGAHRLADQHDRRELERIDHERDISDERVSRGIRNPDAHELFKALDAEEALETLAFASMLMRRLDEAKLRPTRVSKAE
jgi:hypothetical protein